MATNGKKHKLFFAQNIKYEKERCKHHDDYKLKLPLLVVGSQYEHFNAKKFKVLKLQHQTGGIMCHQHYMYAIPIPMSDFLKENIDLFYKNFGENDFSIFGESLKSYNKYNNFLKGKLKLEDGCEDNFYFLEEAIYPISFTLNNFLRLSSMKLSFGIDDTSKLFDLFISKTNSRMPLARLNLFVLTENSD